jgi:hypothetical protein
MRLVQLARMLGLPLATLTPESACAAIASRPGDFAATLFSEAADNDDVTSAPAALDYLGARLAYFGDLVGDAGGDVRRAFASLLEAWTRERQ